MAIKILIADDHALVRQGIKRVLNFENDLEVIGEAEDGQKALGMTLVMQPDVLLLDLNMPVTDGLEVARQLQAARCKTKIIVLTIHDSDNYVLELLKNGASGYLLKDVEPSMLIKAIHIVHDGGTYIYPELEERIFGSVRIGEDINEKAREMWREDYMSMIDDEYDEPVAKANANGYYEQMLDMIRGILSTALKDNTFLN